MTPDQPDPQLNPPPDPQPIRRPDPQPVVARPAATVMVIRDADGDTGVEVFMLRRTTGAAFAAGMYVFPGGRVDDVDGADELEPFSPGIDDAMASAALGLDRGGLAYWVAAIRECFEEAGVLLARRRGDGGPPAPTPNDRVAVHDGELSMVALCHRDDLVLSTSSLRYVAHWVTPEQERPRRFDTRFFLAAAPSGQEGIHDDVETIASAWVRPGDALQCGSTGEMILMPPTLACLKFLDGCWSVAAALAKADEAGPPERIQPSLVFDADGHVSGVSIDGRFVSMPGSPERRE